eukprot:XP_028343908.1 dynein light chain 1, cytoplasmic-like [Physeter catodon]
MPNVQETIMEMEPNSEMHNDALAQAALAVQKYETEKEISRHIKTFFDAKYSPNWHCIVGKNFANYASYECKCYLMFYVGQTAILLYKMG